MNRKIARTLALFGVGAALLPFAAVAAPLADSGDVILDVTRQSDQGFLVATNSQTRYLVPSLEDALRKCEREDRDLARARCRQKARDAEVMYFELSKSLDHWQFLEQGLRQAYNDCTEEAEKLPPVIEGYQRLDRYKVVLQELLTENGIEYPTQEETP